MHLNINFLKIFVLISIVRCVYLFNISNPKCLYEEEGAVFPEVTSNISLHFFLPFNWEKWSENHELIITSNQLKIVLSHPSNRKSSEWMKEKKKVEFLTSDYLRIGWNRIWLVKSRQNVVISDVYGNVWFNKSSEPFQTWNNWKAQGLFAFVNCDDPNYRYFNVNESNYKLPLVAEFNQGELAVYAENGFELDISFSGKHETICRSSFNNQVNFSSIDEANPCFDNIDGEASSGDNETFSGGEEYKLILNIRKDENSLTIGYFTYTDFLIHDLNKSGFMVRSQIYFRKVFYLNYNSRESLIESEGTMEGGTSKTFTILVVCSLFALIIIIIIAACIIRRRLRTVSVSITKDK